MLRFPMTMWPSDSPGTPLATRLSFDLSDPLAVQLAFLQGSRETVVYRFARDLLAEGLDQRAGEGDVTIEPHPEMPWEYLRVVVRPESGYPFELYVERARIESAVNAIYRLAPMGSRRVLRTVSAAVDQVISRLLEGEAA